MVEEFETEEKKEPTITVLEDSIVTGILHAKDHPVIPHKKSDNQVIFHVEGDIEKSIQEIYENCPIGALDVLRSIKLIRSMIFNLRGQK